MINLLKKIFFLLIFVFCLIVIILYSRGYRLNLKEKDLNAIGIVSINSEPNAAKIYINNQLKGITNQNFQLTPGEYLIEIKKDGYTSWQKKLKVKGELVYNLQAQLFPINPSLIPVTNIGVVKAIAIDQTEKILIFSDKNNPQKDGIYLFETNKRPLSLFPPIKLLILKSKIPLEKVDFKDVWVEFSPDYKEAIINFNQNQENNRSFIINLEAENNELTDVTNSKEMLLNLYQEEKQKEINKILESFPKEITKIASSSFEIISLSPDKTKILYQVKSNLSLPSVLKKPLIASNQTPEKRQLKKDVFYVYDKKEDKNYSLEDFKFEKDNPPQWHSNSNQLIFSLNKKISVVDFDGINLQTIYSGPYENNFFLVTADNRIIVLINLNQEINPLPDLYAINLK